LHKNNKQTKNSPF